jgi:hypothetical protein
MADPAQTPPAPGAGLVRAVTLGLAAGVVIAGLALFGVGIRHRLVPPDCRALTREECDLEIEIASTFARTQIGLGLGLAVLGAGGLAWLAVEDRRRRRQPIPPPPAAGA